MKRFETPTLVGRHVTLQPLALEHVDALLLAASAARSTYGFLFVPSSREAMDAYVQAALADREQGEALPFAVRDGAGTVVGSTRFHAIEHWSWSGSPPPPVPLGPDAVEIGHTWYAERVQRTALNTEAKLLLCTYAFETWRVRRIRWKTDERNARSRAAIQRLGARFEGLLRANRAAVDGSVSTTAFFSMLAEEWPAARAALRDKLSPRDRADRESADLPLPR